MTSNFDLFAMTYRSALENAMRNYPAEYGCATIPPHCIADKAQVIADKMIASFKRGDYNKDGRATKATCNALGVKQTYKAINAYLNAPANHFPEAAKE